MQQENKFSWRVPPSFIPIVHCATMDDEFLWHRIDRYLNEISKLIKR